MNNVRASIKQRRTMSTLKMYTIFFVSKQLSNLLSQNDFLVFTPLDQLFVKWQVSVMKRRLYVLEILEVKRYPIILPILCKYL